MSELDDLRYTLLTHTMTCLNDEPPITDDFPDEPPDPAGNHLEKTEFARHMGKEAYDPEWDELLGGGSDDTLHKRSENSAFRFGSNAEPMDAPTVNDPAAARGGDSLAKRTAFKPNWDFSDIKADSEIGRRRRAE